ncbi:phosphatase [Limibacter armeniacum]|uniref:Ppx/GppA phosphatase family protein n=1 Tax=Limibacter armeniacum TaxID=466084 RepID=UPI002FE5B9B8
MIKAAIDLGTNTFQLLIGKVTNGKISPLYQEDIFVRLGKGGISHGQITEDAIQRAIDALSHFRDKIEEFNAQKTYAIATSALRSAANKDEVVSRITNATGITPQIISGEEEASLIYEGVKTDIEIGDENVLIMDIGGGSIEFLLCNDQAICWKRSFEIGAQRLYDLFVTEDPISEKSISKLNDYLSEVLQPLAEAVSLYQPKVLVGSAGTFDSLKMINELQFSHTPKGYYQISLPEYEKIHRLFINQPREQRLLIPGLIDKRVDMIVPASCALQYVLSSTTVETIKISTGSLKEGIMAVKG